MNFSAPRAASRRSKAVFTQDAHNSSVRAYAIPELSTRAGVPRRPHVHLPCMRHVRNREACLVPSVLVQAGLSRRSFALALVAPFLLSTGTSKASTRKERDRETLPRTLCSAEYYLEHIEPSWSTSATQQLRNPAGQATAGDVGEELKQKLGEQIPSFKVDSEPLVDYSKEKREGQDNLPDVKEGIEEAAEKVIPATAFQQVTKALSEPGQALAMKGE